MTRHCDNRVIKGMVRLLAVVVFEHDGDFPVRIVRCAVRIGWKSLFDRFLTEIQMTRHCVNSVNQGMVRLSLRDLKSGDFFRSQSSLGHFL